MGQVKRFRSPVQIPVGKILSNVPYGEVLDADSTQIRKKKNGTTAWGRDVYNAHMQGRICEQHILGWKGKVLAGCEF